MLQLGLLGHPVAQSVSPAMHNAAFQAQSIQAVYGAFDVEPTALKQALEGLRALGFLGVNVTIPHKEAVMAHLDEVAPAARQVGAVNTIVNRDGRLVGYNTDGLGFIASLEERQIRLVGRHAVVLGAGGAARAVALHLALAGVAQVTLTNRTVERAAALVADLTQAERSLSVAAVEAGSAAEGEALSQADLVVNCTPLGMSPNLDGTPIADIGLLRGDAVVYDTIYRPQETRLLREARQRGLQTVGGLSMLVHQGACAWEHWFGRRGPIGVMQAAALTVLGGVP